MPRGRPVRVGVAPLAFAELGATPVVRSRRRQRFRELRLCEAAAFAFAADFRFIADFDFAADFRFVTDFAREDETARPDVFRFPLVFERVDEVVVFDRDLAFDLAFVFDFEDALLVFEDALFDFVFDPVDLDRDVDFLRAPEADGFRDRDGWREVDPPSPPSPSPSPAGSSLDPISFFATPTAAGIATPSAVPATTFCVVESPSSSSSDMLTSRALASRLRASRYMASLNA